MASLIITLSPTDAETKPVKIAPPSIEQLVSVYSTGFGLSTEDTLKVMKCESGGRQFDSHGKVLRGIVNPKDVGLFQINEYYHLEQSNKMGIDIYSTEGNIHYATWLMSKQGLQPWKASQFCWGVR